MIYPIYMTEDEARFVAVVVIRALKGSYPAADADTVPMLGEKMTALQASIIDLSASAAKECV